MRPQSVALALLFAAAPLATAPLAAQPRTPSPRPTDMGGMMQADADKVVGGGLQVPGWTARFDRPDAQAAQQVSFRRMGTGYHVTAGPAAVYYDATQTASGDYTVSASFTQMKAPTHPEAYGLFVGGQGLQGASPAYVYFVVRGDGKYLVKHRANATDVHTLVNWTASPALKTAGPDGKATNALQIRVAADSVRFVANGTPVAAVARGGMLGAMAGTAGIRVNHNLDVHVDGFAVRKGAARSAARTTPPAPRKRAA